MSDVPPDEALRGPDLTEAALLPASTPAPPPRAPNGREVFAACLWLAFFAVLGAAAVVGVKWRYPAVLTDQRLLLPAGLGYEALALLAASILALRRRGLALRRLGVVRLEARWIIASLGVAVGLVLTSELLLTFLRAAGSSDPTTELADLFVEMTPLWFALNLVLGAAVVPLAEEMFYRGLVFGWIADWAGAGIGAVASAAFFAISHVSVSPEYAAVIFLLGIALAWLYRSAGSLWASVIAHGLNNAAAFASLWFGE